MKKLFIILLPLLLTSCNNVQEKVVKGTIGEHDMLTIGGNRYGKHCILINTGQWEQNSNGYTYKDYREENGNFNISYELSASIQKVSIENIGTITYSNVEWRLVSLNG